MTYGILPNGKQQFIDSNGKPLASGKVYYYIPSTTTFKNTYQNSAGTVLNTNPVVLDANGQCIAYGTGSYRQQVYDVYGNLVWDVQVDSPLTSGNQTYDIEEQTFTATSGQTVFTLTTMSYVPGTNNLVVFVDGLKQIVGVNYTETSSTVVTFTTGLHVGAVVDFTTAVLQTNANIVPATDVTYNQGGTGAVTTTVQAKLQQTVSPADFGAVGNGTTNDTSAIQAAINALSAGGVLDGGSKTYAVTTLNLVSNITIQNFNFITIAGSTDFVAPITIGANGNTSTYSNIVLTNVHINGNRQNQTNIGGSGGGEDGGRSGFRIIGHVTNLLIQNCSANYCATDGIEIYTGTGTGSAWPRFQNITVRDSQFNWNRRHGGSGESMLFAQFENCQFNNNGQDLNTTDPLNSGNRGARNSGGLYGNGFDNETYGVGYQSQNVQWLKIVANQNAGSGIIYFDNCVATTSGYVPNSEIIFSECNLDYGTVPSQSSYYALQLTPPAADQAIGPYFIQVIISNCRLSGTLLLTEVQNASVDGGFILIPTGNYCGTVVYSTGIYVGDGINLGGHNFYQSNSTIVYPYRPTDITRVVDGIQTTITSGASYDLGLPGLSTEQAVVRVFNSGASFPTGGAFAVDIYIDGGAGAYVSSIYNGSQVGTTSGNKLQIINNGTTWTLKNNDSASMTLSIYEFT